MKAAAILCAIALGGCSGCDSPTGDDITGDDDPTTAYQDCDSDTATWVRNAYLAIVGTRPHSQTEVDVYVQLHDQLAAQAEAQGEATTIDPKAIVARAMMREPAYLPRWTTHFIDALRVPRLDEQEMSSCYDDGATTTPTAGLAAYVRDNAASSGGPGYRWTMRDLVQSSLTLDDVSPIYRGHLFALVNFPIPAANVPEVEAELARREDFGGVFDSAYLNRDLVCLGCHNSAGSVTDSPDPLLDRHWPMAGLFEQSIYGQPNGIEHERAHAVFRFDSFAATAFDEGPRKPWGWDQACGSFYSSPGADPAGVDGKFANLSGDSLTVYDLDGALRAGFDALRGGALAPEADGTIADPDQAFAYLVSATIVEGVWKEVIGSSLTIANYFPRNEAARDLLQGLTNRFIASGYSLGDLLIAITETDFFSRQMPDEGCGDAPYLYPNVFDPWVISDTDEARRLNGAGDGIAAISARTLMRTAYEALEWPVPDKLDFPAGGGGEAFCAGASCPELQNACNQGFCCDTYQDQCVGGGGAEDELPFQAGVGAFLKNGERGFRGLDFQARLVWEDRFGACTNPNVTGDFVDDLIAAAQADSTATVEDVVEALKDRLIGHPGVDHGGDRSEADAIGDLYGGALSRSASTVTNLETSTRQLCGVLLSSPQFVLSGAAGKSLPEAPKLTPTAFQFDAVCDDLAARTGTSATVTCADGTLTVTVPPPDSP